MAEKCENWQQTAEMFQSLFEKPKMSEKLLSKPPFKYIFDIINETTKATGFGNGLYTGEEAKSEFYNSKDSKIHYLRKVIELCQLMTKQEVPAKPNKVVAGLEPENTNLLLQTVYKLAVSNVDSQPFVKKVLAKLANSTEGQETKQEKPEATKDSQQPKPQQQQPQQQQEKRSQQKQTEEAKAEQQLAKNKDTDQEVQQKVPSQKQKAKQQEDALKKEQQQKELMQLQQQKDEEKRQQQQQQQQQKQQQQQQAQASQKGTKKEVPQKAEVQQGVKQQAKINKKGQQEEQPEIVNDDDENGENEQQEQPLQNQQDVQNIEEHGKFIQNAMMEGQEIPQSQNQGGDQNNEDDSNQGPKIKMKLHGGKKKPVAKGSTDVTTTNNVQGDAQALASVGSSQSDVESLIKLVQTITQNAHPLGKSLEFINDDIESMNQELDYWSKQYQSSKDKMQVELKKTEDALQPVQDKIAEIDMQVKDMRAKIQNTKAQIIKNGLLINKYAVIFSGGEQKGIQHQQQQ